MTRAVLPTTLEINQKPLGQSDFGIDYIYRDKPNQTIPLMVNATGTSEVLKYDITPFIYNANPQNSTEKVTAFLTLF